MSVIISDVKSGLRVLSPLTKKGIENNRAIQLKPSTYCTGFSLYTLIDHIHLEREEHHFSCQSSEIENY